MLQLTVILLIIGAGFLIAEMFIPGFGVLGILGIILSITSFVLTALYLPGGLFIVFMELFVFGLIIFIFYKYMQRTQRIKQIVLSESLNMDAPDIESYDYFLGKEAVTVTSLRPFGDADFNGNIISVCSDGNYIAENVKVKVMRIEGNKVIVTKVGN